MSEFPNSVMCKLKGGEMDGQIVPIDREINRIEMYTAMGMIAYKRVNKNTFKIEKG